MPQQPSKFDEPVIRSEFDQYSRHYETYLEQSIRVSGESARFFSDYKARYIARVLSRPGKVLDFGCGVGLLTSSLQRYLPQCEIHGFDSSPASIAAIEPRVRSNGKFSANIAAIDNDYDVVVIANVLHHIAPAERDSTLREVAGRMADSALLFIFEHNPLNPFTRWAVSQCVFDDGAILLWPSEAKQRLSRAGLLTIRRDYIVFFPAMLSRLRVLEPHLGWCPLGAQYVVVATPAD